MQRTKRNVRIVVDGYTRVCLTAIAVLLTVAILGLWSDGMHFAATARANGDENKMPFGDAPGDRKAMIDAQEKIVAKLDELIKVLKSGDVKVQTMSADDAPKSTGGGSEPASKNNK